MRAQEICQVTTPTCVQQRLRLWGDSEEICQARGRIQMIASWGPGVRLEMNQVNFNCYHIQLWRKEIKCLHHIIRKKKLAYKRNKLQRHEKVLFHLCSHVWRSEGCILKILVRKNKKIPYSGTSISWVLSNQHCYIVNTDLVNYYPRATLDVFRWLGLPQILMKTWRQKKYGRDILQPGCRHPDCLVVSEEGLTRFYPDVDFLDPDHKKISIYIMEPHLKGKPCIKLLRVKKLTGSLFNFQTL